MQEDEEFSKAFEGFGEEPDTSVTPPAEDNKGEDNAKDDTPTGDDTKSATPDDNTQPPAVPSDKEADKDDGANKDVGTAGEPVQEKPDDTGQPEVTAPQPLTKEDVESVVSNLLNTERSSAKEIETATTEVLEKYYPDGLSNTLVDEQSGRELKTPQDVVDASGGSMTTEEASQWLMNEQFKLDQQVKSIQNDARKIAETTTSFKRDAVEAVKKYEPLFEKFPHLQQKVFDKLMKYVERDEAKGVILKAPDVMEHYDDYLEPYQIAYEHSLKQSATNPTPAPEPPKPTAEDRMDISGDGGTAPVNDPNDFAQQVSKELAKGI